MLEHFASKLRKILNVVFESLYFLEHSCLKQAIYTILPIQFSIDQFYQRQLDAVDRAKERQRVARRMERTGV